MQMPTTTNKDKIFFPGLNSLRAIGAIAVFIGHVEQLRKMSGLRNNLFEFPFFRSGAGHLGVILFFVLSGFLITYLLLEENRRTGTIAIKKFYVRRVLRIWPLYYWALLIAFFIMPFLFAEYPGRDLDNFIPKFVLDILFVPNISLIAIGGISGASHLWSIGVEEQFYLMWPAIIKRFYNYALYALIAIFIGITLLPHAIDFTNHRFIHGDAKTFKTISSFFYQFKINAMALGGIIAWLYHKHKAAVLNIIFKRYVEIPVFLSTAILWLSGWKPKMFVDEFYSVLFAVVIANVALNPKPVFSLRNKLLDFYGSISYGFYVYHWVVIIIVLKLLMPILDDSYGTVVTDIAIYSACLLFTTLVSYVSYHYFEKRILTLKQRFTVIASGGE